MTAAVHPLDNAAWHALTTYHAGFAEGSGRVRRYQRDVGVFAAADDLDDDSWAALGELAGPGRTVAMFRDGVPAAPIGWTELMRGDGHQMVLGRSVPPPPDDDTPPIRPLTVEDVPAMLALVELAQPGPFQTRTIELGGYVGVVAEGCLLAMAGERFHLPGYAEISAVCTHPAARGRGLGATVTTHVARAIVERGEQPFLHVASTNDSARRVYERLGFTTRRMTQFAAFTTPAAGSTQP